MIGLQDEALINVPTVLVCPLQQKMAVIPSRVRIIWEGRELVACLELARPIRRTALRAMGHLDEWHSRQVMSRFLQLLAR